MLKIVALAVTTVVLLSSGETNADTLKGELVENVNATYVDYGEEWDLKYFKHDSFAEYMPKKEVPEIVEEYVVEEEVIEYEEEYLEEVHLGRVDEEVFENEIYEEFFEETVEEPVEETIEEFSYSSGISFEATAYAIGGWAVPSTMTAMGTEISNTIYTSSGYRIIATDPNVIPMGTVVRVTYSDGTTFLAQADDKGGMIVGNRIDILYDNVDDALTFGRQNVTVEFIN